MSSGMGLDRFVEAQEGIYEQALAELREGKKRSHWMWFVFPQIAGLSLSATGRFFEIADLAEAKTYLAHDLLGRRLVECTEAMQSHAGRISAEAVLGPIDALKFCSSMTLFEAAGGGEPFAGAIAAFYGERRDSSTLDLLGL
jgi:uncharacterized protein (DUF1810 family)